MRSIGRTGEPDKTLGHAVVAEGEAPRRERSPQLATRPVAPLPTVGASTVAGLTPSRQAKGRSHGGLSVRLADAEIVPLAEVEAPRGAPLERAAESARSSGPAPAPAAEAAQPSAAPEDVAAVSAPRRSLPARLARAVAAPVRELAYLARTFLRELAQPTKGEVVEGIAAKAVPFVASAGAWGAMLLPAHPVAYAAAMALSVSLETLHGVFIKSWMNFQNAIGKERGVNYQSIFNLAYFQATGAAFRAISWSALPNVVPPWALQYWRDLGLVTIVGSFFGTLGYNGLNELYNKGVISQKTRDRIQQFGRDGFFLMSGMFFGTGAMSFFWPLFLVQQSVDLALYLAGAVARPRPGAPRAPDEPTKPALRAALDAMLQTPFLAPFAALYRLLSRKKQGAAVEPPPGAAAPRSTP